MMNAIVSRLAKSKIIADLMFSLLLFGLYWMFDRTAAKHPFFSERLREKDLTVQIRLKDRSRGRYYVVRGGEVSSRGGIHAAPDVTVIFGSSRCALSVLVPPRDQLAMINAMKSFQMGLEGPEELSSWFMETLSLMLNAGVRYGTDMGDGEIRFTTNSNGGPLFVYVREGKIVRITPIEFDDKDAPSWTIIREGQVVHAAQEDHYLAPRAGFQIDDLLPRPAPLSHEAGSTSIQRAKGTRRTSAVSRATSASAGKRPWTSWPTRSSGSRRVHGPGAILNGSGSHHLWGILGYWLSARLRFFNNIGWTPVGHNPDSWEGWYWGAMHHWGQSMHLGAPETYGTVEDCLKDCEMVVFWSSDPEATSGVYAAHEGTVRRQWLKELGITMVHIDPFYNHTAALFGGKWLAPRPATGNAMALAIAYVWITEDLYDKEYVADRTVGFDKWRAYILGEEDGTPKTPEWQEEESGIPAKDVRALARLWGTKKTYLAAGGLSGFGGACRDATGTEWARSMVCLMAMQGLGKPGINMGSAQQGTPIDTGFYFPGLRGRRPLGRSRGHRPRRRPLPAHAPARLDEHGPPGSPAAADSRGHPRRPDRGYFTDSKTIEGQFRRYRIPGARLFACQDVLQVRRLPLGHHVRDEPLCPDVPLRQTGVRGEPVHLVRGRSQVRRYHPAGLHQFRAVGHQRIRQLRRLYPAQLQPVQPPRRRDAA